MNKNKSRDMTPYPMHERPKRPAVFMLPVMWAASWFMVRKGGLKVRKLNMDGMKPPYLVLAQHQGFLDYAIAPLALFPRRASYVSDVEGFANYGKRLYSWLGCLPVRRFNADLAAVHNIRHALKQNGDIVVLFPEARHSNVGTASLVPDSYARLVKLLQVPVVVLKTHGSYLSCPIWDEDHQRKAPVETRLEKVWDPEDLKQLSVADIHTTLCEHFTYDEYAWQRENRVAITEPKRAEGLHKVLYQCPDCLREGAITSQGSRLTCRNCGQSWQMDELGQLEADRGSTAFAHIPDWYQFEQNQVAEQIRTGNYQLDLMVNVEALPNDKGFVALGTGHLVQDAQGFTLNLDRQGEMRYFSSAFMVSVHTEYDYRDRGDCLVLSTRDCCYYVYPQEEGQLNVTKVQFAAELFYGWKGEAIWARS